MKITFFEDQLFLGENFTHFGLQSGREAFFFSLLLSYSLRAMALYLPHKYATVGQRKNKNNVYKNVKNFRMLVMKTSEKRKSSRSFSINIQQKSLQEI